MIPKLPNLRMRTDCSVAVSLYYDVMRTEAFRRFRTIQTNNVSLPFALATTYLTLFAAIMSMLAIRFTRSTKATLTRLHGCNNQRSPKQYIRRIHRSNSPG